MKWVNQRRFDVFYYSNTFSLKQTVQSVMTNTNDISRDL